MENPLFSSGEETYMDEKQLNYFKNKLIQQKMDALEKINLQKANMKNLRSDHADILDRSNSMMEIERVLQSQERNVHRIKQIDAALHRIEDGSFGYCILTGKQIGLKRLEILPFTSISIEALAQSDNFA